MGFVDVHEVNCPIWGCNNSTTNFINNTVVGMLTRLQDKYGKLMPHKILERKDIVKNTTCNPQYPLTTIFSAVEELLDFANITGKSYTQLQEVDNAYVIFHRIVKFELLICEWNFMPTIHKTWV